MVQSDTRLTQDCCPAIAMLSLQQGRAKRVSDPVPRPAHPEAEPLKSRPDRADSKALLLALIDTLIDIDVVYERECKADSQRLLNALAKSQSLKRLREQHQQRRQPFVQQLAALQERV
jgi:hypothetical protein